MQVQCVQQPAPRSTNCRETVAIVASLVFALPSLLAFVSTQRRRSNGHKRYRIGGGGGGKEARRGGVRRRASFFFFLFRMPILLRKTPMFVGDGQPDRAWSGLQRPHYGRSGGCAVEDAAVLGWAPTRWSGRWSSERPLLAWWLFPCRIVYVHAVCRDL